MKHLLPRNLPSGPQFCNLNLCWLLSHLLDYLLQTWQPLSIQLHTIGCTGFCGLPFSIGGDLLANKAMGDSPKVKADQKLKTQTAELEAKNKQLVSANASQAKQLDELNVENKKLAQKLETNGKLAKETVSKVHRRLTESVLRNIASLPSESVPFVGIAFVIGATSMDIYDACQTMKDFNALLVRLGEGEEKPDFCGQKTPSVEEIKESIKKRFRKKEAS